MPFHLSSAARKALTIGSICIASYFTVYLARNVLGASTPQMIESGALTTEQAGYLSSIFFVTYAVGQLINGMIGDRIHAKFMVALGLILAGISNLFFTHFSDTHLTSYITYGLVGFSLSMIYGPMTKAVSENTEYRFATRISLGFTFVSFFGSPLAGLLAATLVWRTVFLISSAALIAIGIVFFLLFTHYEKRGLVQYDQFQRTKSSGGGIRVLIKRQILKFSLISIITGIVRTTVIFWLPTYISQYLGFSANHAALLYTVVTLVISITPPITMFLYERLHRNMDRTIAVSFIAAAVFFGGAYLLPAPAANLVCMTLAIMASNSAASMLWSYYCPSLYDTGMVSAATGFLDFVSYFAAAVSSILFANALESIGWGNLIFIWLLLMIIGAATELPFKKLFRKK